jgi:hypothetical protein
LQAKAKKEDQENDIAGAYKHYDEGLRLNYSNGSQITLNLKTYKPYVKPPEAMNLHKAFVYDDREFPTLL